MYWWRKSAEKDLTKPGLASSRGTLRGTKFKDRCQNPNWQTSSSCERRYFNQYVARPPEMSKTAPVENEHSSLANHATIAANSSGLPSRPIGIFDNI